jgi:hypothetical protein
MTDLLANLANLPGNTSTGTMDIFQPGLFPSSYSGMDRGFSSSTLESILPLLQRSLSSLPNSSSNFMRSNAGGVLQDAVNNLSSRGILNSSVASNTLARTASNLGGQAMQMQANLPSILGQLATNVGNYSYQSNPLAPYQLLNNFITSY